MNFRGILALLLLPLLSMLPVAVADADDRRDYQSHHPSYPPEGHERPAERQQLPRDRLKPSWPFHRDSTRRYYGKPPRAQRFVPHYHHRTQPHSGHYLDERPRLVQDGRYLRAMDDRGHKIGQVYLRHDERWFRQRDRIYVRGPHKLEHYSAELDFRGRIYLRPNSRVQFEADGISVHYGRLTENYSLDLKLRSKDYH